MPRNKYPTHVQPYLGKIKEMARTMTEEQICKALGVGKDAWIRYKDAHQELRDALKKGRVDLCLEIKSTLIRTALGFQYEEKKQIIENGIVIHEEVYVRSSPPDVAAMHLLLKNLDDSWRNDDMETVKQKRRQLDIAQQKADDAEYS